MNLVSRSVRFACKLVDRVRSKSRKFWVRLKYPECKFGKGVYVGSGVLIKPTDGGLIVVGDHSTFADNCVVIARGGSLIIGANTFVGWGTVICAIEDIQIGNDCLIAEYVSIRDQNHGIELSRGNFNSQPITSAHIHIADNVWIGAKCSVLAGVSIGRDSVLAANAVVTRNVAEATVVGGVPAKVIRQLDR